MFTWFCCSFVQKCPSDSELASDLGDDNESIQSTTDSIDTASSFQESDFINPKGVRFTQIQGYREGTLIRYTQLLLHVVIFFIFF